MTLVLDSWSRRWQSVAFDPRTGKASVRWLSRRPDRCAGFAVRHRWTWYGLWSDGQNAIFQSGARRIPMLSTHDVSNVRSGPMRTFTVDENGKRVFELTYRAIDRDRDPTFDDLDLELEDFFVYVSRLWSDDRRRSALTVAWASSAGR